MQFKTVNANGIGLNSPKDFVFLVSSTVCTGDNHMMLLMTNPSKGQKIVVAQSDILFIGLFK
jgi:hypothetical protein